MKAGAWSPALKAKSRSRVEDSWQVNGLTAYWRIWYRDGNDSVSWHADDEKRVLGPNPVVASVSLGATRTFELKHKTSGFDVKTRSASLCRMEPCSLMGEHAPESTGCTRYRKNGRPSAKTANQPDLSLRFTPDPERCNVRSSDQFDITIVGAGVIGLAIAECLSTATVRSRTGTSSCSDTGGGARASISAVSNSEVIHAGIYYAPGNSLKAETLRVAGQRTYSTSSVRRIRHPASQDSAS